MKRNDIPNNSEVLCFFSRIFIVFFFGGGCWGKGKGHAAKHQHGHADQRRFHRKPRRSSDISDDLRGETIPDDVKTDLSDDHTNRIHGIGISTCIYQQKSLDVGKYAVGGMS